MANPDLIAGFENEKQNSSLMGIVVLVAIVIVVIYILLMIFNKNFQKSMSEQPDCRYYGDEYVCE